VPTLVVGGWWDQEDLYGALATYKALEKSDRINQNFLVRCPWNHGGWNSFGRTLGKLTFGSATGAYFRKEIQAPWFAHYLKENNKLKQPEALMFRTGCNQWTAADQWPPAASSPRNLFFLKDKKL
jgi:uncharacterized protein